MFAQQIFQDFKENVKCTAPTKSSTTSNSRKGLKSCSSNNFNGSKNLPKSKNDCCLESKSSSSKLFSGEKENSKPKSLPQKENTYAEDAESDIEQMHICIEPDDDYEDILPQCERIQKKDIDALFLPYSFTRYAELIDDSLPSPPVIKFETFDIFDLSPPLSPSPIKAFLFDDSELDFIPEPPPIKASLFDDSELDIIPEPSDFKE